jgi:antagonist of KipI
MSIRIIKAGLFDTVQDGGRYGVAHLGIGAGGAMDRFSAALANALLGKEANAPVLELHFPAAQLLLEEDTVIALTGADFGAQLNGKPLLMNHPVAVGANSLLQFTQLREGSRCYLALLAPPALEPWLGSWSTHTRAGAGGLQGRTLQRYDQVPYTGEKRVAKKLGEEEFEVLHWGVVPPPLRQDEVSLLMGPEWHWITPSAQQQLLDGLFTIGHAADRMGYRLQGPRLERAVQGELLSSAVTFGTLQCLPNGQLVLLMADHQTTGGYPRIAQAISAHLPALAQKGAGNTIRFQLTELATAEAAAKAQRTYLDGVREASAYRLAQWMG